MSEYLNVYTDTKIENFNYLSQVDSKIIKLVANYLKECQDNNTQFDY